MSTTVVSIGRNLSGTYTPLDSTSWQTFAAEVTALLRRLGEVFFTGFGTGFDPTTTDTEDSFTVVGSVPPTVHHELRHELAFLADRYKQSSIAVTFGDTEFVEADRAEGWEG